MFLVTSCRVSRDGLAFNLGGVVMLLVTSSGYPVMD